MYAAQMLNVIYMYMYMYIAIPKPGISTVYRLAHFLYLTLYAPLLVMHADNQSG